MLPPHLIAIGVESLTWPARRVAAVGCRDRCAIAAMLAGCIAWLPLGPCVGGGRLRVKPGDAEP
jgi:hypothetical protein